MLTYHAVEDGRGVARRGKENGETRGGRLRMTLVLIKRYFTRKSWISRLNPSPVICILLRRTLFSKYWWYLALITPSTFTPCARVVTSTNRIDIKRLGGEPDSTPGDRKSQELLWQRGNISSQQIALWVTGKAHSFSVAAWEGRQPLEATTFHHTAGPVAFGKTSGLQRRVDVWVRAWMWAHLSEFCYWK